MYRDEAKAVSHFQMSLLNQESEECPKGDQISCDRPTRKSLLFQANEKSPDIELTRFPDIRDPFVPEMIDESVQVVAVGLNRLCGKALFNDEVMEKLIQHA